MFPVAPATPQTRCRNKRFSLSLSHCRYTLPWLSLASRLPGSRSSMYSHVPASHKPRAVV